MSQPVEVRIDLHVHSSHSDKPYSWFLRATKSAECYTTPQQVYELAQSRGMNLVTICDHDAIDGAVELCGLYPDTFVSEEVSARFPEDGCIVHVIALDITEAQHREIQRLRRNIYELVVYLDQQGIACFVCHPLSPVNRRLTPTHVQRCLLMFRNLELRNGTRDRAHEEALLRVTGGLTREILARWAEQFPATPVLNATGRYAFVGGSDDHAGLSIARAFTSFVGERSGRGVTAALHARATTPSGETATPDVLAHNVYGVIAGHIARTGQLEALSKAGEALVATGGPSSMLELAQAARRGHTDAAQARLHAALESVLVRMGREAGGAVLRAVETVRPADLADAVPDLLKALMLGAPYLAGGRAFAQDRRTARSLSARLGFPAVAQRVPRVAVVSDSLDEVNGVAIGLRRLAAGARRDRLDLRLVGVGPGEHVTVDADGVVRVPNMMTLRIPEYPQLPLGVPHVPSLLDYLLNEEIDLVQCSTPGPAGLAGLLAGRLAGLPVIGQFHTDVPEYATRLTGDPMVGALAARYVGWFYGMLDEVLAPSRAVVDRLRALGVADDKVRLVPRGIDLELFTPARRNAHAFEPFGLNGEPKVLYVGRVSREKGLDVLVDGFRELAGEIPAAKLVVVGDGPYGGELARRSEAAPAGSVIFTGEMTGARLAELYASSDVFVYPSETETFGNAVVEAQAAGVPVVVANRGAAHEQMIDGVTGLAVDARSPREIRAALGRLLRDPDLRRNMGAEAARFAQRYDIGRAARGTFEVYADILRGRHATTDTRERVERRPAPPAEAHRGRLGTL